MLVNVHETAGQVKRGASVATPPGFGDVSVKLTLTGFNRSAYITFGIDPTGTDPDLVAQACYTSLAGAGALFSQLDSNVMIAETRVRLGTDGGEDLLGTHVTTTTGGRSGASVPPNVSLLVHKRTARGGRRGRGRWYIPWLLLTTQVAEDGTLNAGVIGPLQTAMNTTLTALTTNNVPMCVLHEPGTTAEGAPNVVTSLTVSNIVATQRRRLGR